MTVAKRQIGGPVMAPQRNQQPKAFVLKSPPQNLENVVMAIPLHPDSFTRIRCTRKEATTLQKRVYDLNKNNAANRVIATRYMVEFGELLLWRMA